jgi:hypothetical protein
MNNVAVSGLSKSPFGAMTAHYRYSEAVWQFHGWSRPMKVF